MIPNIVKGRGISGTIAYVMGEGNDKETKQRKELAPGQDSRTEILGGQNFPFRIDSPETVDIARRMMEEQARHYNQTSPTAKTDNDCLHLSLSWNEGEQPSRDEMLEAATSSLQALGMERAQAVFFSHSDTVHRHMHVVASRIDFETGRSFSDKDDFAAAQEWALQWEEQHNQIGPARQNLHDIRAAVKSHDGPQVLELLTERNPTFTGRELDRAIGYGGLAKDEARALRIEILQDPQTITLLEPITIKGEAKTRNRYTTLGVIEEEQAVLASAGRLDAKEGFALSEPTRARVAEQFTLTAEQRAALDHVSQDNGLALIVGEAGTGKSQTLKAVREGGESEGFTVIGLAQTNKVVDGMRQDGFGHASTLALELDQFNNRQPGQRPCDRWDEKTILLVDEAAQLSTHALNGLMTTADRQGAKVVLVGDDKQFASIERGGLFTLLAADRSAGGYGAAAITEVQRVKDQDQRQAWRHMHDGDFGPALKIFDQQGAIHWTNSQEGAVDALIKRYGQDMAADPSKDRFILAATNEAVRSLNDQARQLARDTGKLGDQQVLAATATGPLEIAVGDRIQLNVNGRRAEKANGIVKDAVGTITALDVTEQGKPIVTLQFDAKPGDEAKEATFTVGDDRKAGEINQFSRGYAGTTYKSQGRTLDQTYVLHSSHWQASASYVALTRHRESVALFVAQESIVTAEPWMMERQGFACLNGQHQASAERSYEAWSVDNPIPAAKYDIGSYVRYVQKQWEEENAGKTDVDRLAARMGRDDLKRAALGYEIAPASLVRSGLAGAEIFERHEQPEPPAAPPRAAAAPADGHVPALAGAVPALSAAGNTLPHTGGRADGATPSSAPMLPDESFVDPLARPQSDQELPAAQEFHGPGLGHEAVAATEYGITVAGELAGEAGEKLLDFVSRLTDSFTGSPARKYSASELARDPGARRENYARQAAMRDSDEAIDRIRLDLEAGRRVQPADVRSLTIDHLLQIKAHGDDYVRQMVGDREREQARSSGRERDR